MNNKQVASLYNIELRYLQLIEAIEDNEGVMTDEQIEEFDKLVLEEFPKKMDAYGVARKMLENDQNLLKDRISTLKAAIDSKESIRKRLADRMIHALELFGEDNKNGNKQFKSEAINCWLSTKKGLELSDKDIEDFGQYSIMNVDLHLSQNDLNEVFEFITKKFGDNKVFKKGAALKKTKFIDACKNGVVVKKVYYFDKIGNQQPVSEKEAITEGFVAREILTDINTGETFPDIDYVDKTSLTVRV